MIYYLSNDDDTGTDYGNSGTARKKKCLKKCYLVFCPLPRINVGNIYASNGGVELRKKSDTKILFGFFTPFPLINVGIIYESNAGAAPTKKCF